jgi:hypothetical protein
MIYNVVVDDAPTSTRTMGAILISVLLGLMGPWFLLNLSGPGELRMDLLGIHFARRWHRRSTPWKNVKKVSWVHRNKTLLIEFVQTPFPWYEVYRWINMFALVSENGIWLDDDRWTREDLKAIAEHVRKMLAQEEIGDAPPEF